MIVNDGTASGQAGIFAPDVPGVDNFAVEAEIQFISVGEGNDAMCNTPTFGILARIDQQDNSLGYLGGVTLELGASCVSPPQAEIWYFEDILSDEGYTHDTGIGAQNYAPDNDWHTYRLEVEGNTLRLYIDGGLVVEVTDNRYLESGRVGLWSDGVQLSVRNFQVIVL